MLRFLRCYYLHFTRHSELLRGSFVVSEAVRHCMKEPFGKDLNPQHFQLFTTKGGHDSEPRTNRSWL